MTASKNFTKTWSNRFLTRVQHSVKKTAYPGRPDVTVPKWLSDEQLLSTTCWSRMIYEKWQGAKVSHPAPIMTWMMAACSYPCFVRNRNVHNYDAGYQLWFSHEDDVMLAKMSIPDAVIQIRKYTTPELSDQIKDHFSVKVVYYD